MSRPRGPNRSHHLSETTVLERRILTAENEAQSHSALDVLLDEFQRTLPEHNRGQAHSIELEQTYQRQFAAFLQWRSCGGKPRTREEWGLENAREWSLRIISHESQGHGHLDDQRTVTLEVQR
jgi:hypothetical protein